MKSPRLKSKMAKTGKRKTPSFQISGLRIRRVVGVTQPSATSNLLIQGENSQALSTILDCPSISQRVRLIYIDPPFSTRQEFRIGVDRVSTISHSATDRLAYRDTLKGEEYLRFLRERLVLLRALLADDGSLYFHIDDKIGHYVKVLLDEIFGIRNFRNDITRIKCNPKNFARKGFGNVKDVILFYTKSSRFVWNEPSEVMKADDIDRLFPRVDPEGRRYTTTPLHAPGETHRGATGKSWKGLRPPAGRHWRVPPEELSRLDALKLIEWSETGNPRKKIFAEGKSRRGKKVQDIWEFKDPPYPAYPTQKNIGVLNRIIAASSSPGDLVLDAFAGSGTTLIAAQGLARRWIGIDASAHAVNVAQKRLQGLGSHVSFVLCECAAPTNGRQSPS